jgi:RHS repeat-associated protein
VVGRNIDGSNSQTVIFDSLGRITNVLNLLAPTSPGFAYSYYDLAHPTNRVGSLSYPNGQSTVYNYFGNTGDERLQEIKNLKTTTGPVLSQDDYTYSADGKIATWQEQTDSNPPVQWTEGYDAADQLTSAVLTNPSIFTPAVRSDSYGYDAAGNLTTFNVSGVLRNPTYNALNQLIGSTPSGTRTVGFTGSLNDSATVTVNGTPATTNSSHDFAGTASLTTASTNTVATVAVVATDTHGNVTTNNYQTVVPAELTYSPTFDSDGNELSNGAGENYIWDAKNELIIIDYTAGPNLGNHTEFAYDALGHRIAIVERTGTGTTVGTGTVISTKQLVWDEDQIAEERNGSSTPVTTKRFFGQGEQIGTNNYYYTRDHLGSAREMTDSSGNIQARYDYDPYGRVAETQGSLASDFQYAGYYEHATSGLNLTWFRAYDPNTARWLSSDPLPDAERSQGPNLYEYVSNSPIGLTDPLGLAGGGGGNRGGQCPCGQHRVFFINTDRADANAGVVTGGGPGMIVGTAGGAVAYGLGAAASAPIAAVYVGDGIIASIVWVYSLPDSKCVPN